MFNNSENLTTVYGTHFSETLNICIILQFGFPENMGFIVDN